MQVQIYLYEVLMPLRIMMSCQASEQAILYSYLVAQAFQVKALSGLPIN